MCTAITFSTHDHYFGRNLDFEHDFNEIITITPRNYPFPFRCLPTLNTHFAMIGMAVVVDNYPLYFDATNEKGVSMAGLYFPGNAVYLPKASDMDNVTPFEFIPWILSQCESLEQVKEKLAYINIVDMSYSEEYPLSPLHWIIAKDGQAITVEPTATGIKIYDNPMGVLTNNPPFDYHLYNLSNYMNLTREEPSNRFAPKQNFEPYSRGMGAIGLPGDLSSSSRFIRACFTKLNSACDPDEISSVSQFFHILASVSQTNGCAKVGDAFERTIYSSCCNTSKGIYYYNTYENFQIHSISLHKSNINSEYLHIFPLDMKANINMHN